MLLFHEGLPGSGKSYAAIKDHVVPALQKGRKVCAYIEGLDHARIALVAGISEERCRELLIQIDRNQVARIDQHVINDSFVVIDELQDFWPSGRQKLGPEITEFITQHRHRGLDILCMGQVLADCHAMWRNRVDQNVYFYNRDAIGKPDEYKWSVRKLQSNGKFAEVTNGTAKYDQSYFGTYASHVAGTENLTKYEDKRANVFNSPVFRRFIPAYLALALVALGVVIWAFKGGLASSAKVEQAKLEQAKDVTSGAGAPGNAVQAPILDAKPAAPAAQAEKVEPPDDYIDQLSLKYRTRVGGVITGMGRSAGWIEWREDSGNGLRERLSFTELGGLGWLVMVTPDGTMVTLTKGAKRYYATAWPIEDPAGKVSEATNRRVAGGEAG